jgi:hypothetical protein
MNLGLSLTLGSQGVANGSIVGFIGAASGGAGSGTSSVVAASGDWEVGDVLIAYGIASLANPHNTPSGWTQVVTGNGYTLFHRLHDGSASYTFTTSASVAQAVQIVAHRGYAFGAASALTSAGVNPTPPSLSVAANDSVVLQIVAAQAADVTWSMAAGWTQRATYGASSRSIRSFQRDALAASGALAGSTMTRSTGSVTGVAVAVSLSPVP